MEGVGQDKHPSEDESPPRPMPRARSGAQVHKRHGSKVRVFAVIERFAHERRTQSGEVHLPLTGHPSVWAEIGELTTHKDSKL